MRSKPVCFLELVWVFFLLGLSAHLVLFAGRGTVVASDVFGYRWGAIASLEKARRRRCGDEREILSSRYVEGAFLLSRDSRECRVFAFGSSNLPEQR